MVSFLSKTPRMPLITRNFVNPATIYNNSRKKCLHLLKNQQNPAKKGRKKKTRCNQELVCNQGEGSKFRHRTETKKFLHFTLRVQTGGKKKRRKKRNE